MLGSCRPGIMAAIKFSMSLAVLGMTAVKISCQPMEPIVGLLLDGIEPPFLADVERLVNISFGSGVTVVDITEFTPFQLSNHVCVLASAGMVTMVTQARCPAIHTLSSAADNLNLTLIAEHSDCDLSYDDPDHDLPDEVAVHADTIYVKARSTPYMDWMLRDVLINLKWQHLLVVYEEKDSNADLLRSIDSVFDVVNSTAQMFRVDQTTLSRDIDHILSYMMANMDQRHVLVVCSLRCISYLLEQANLLDETADQQALFTFGVHWLAVAKAEQLEQVLPSVQNLNHFTALSPPRYSMVESTLLEEMLHIVNVTHSRVSQKDDWEWESTVTQCGTKLQAVDNLTQELQVNLTQYFGQDETPFEIHSVMWKANGARQYDVVGEWNEQGLVLFDDVFPNIKNYLNGKFFVIGTNLWEPFVMYDDNATVGYKGYCMDLLRMLGVTLNFSYVLVEPSDGEWGIYRNGTYTGLVGQLHNKEVDVVVAPLSYSVDRSQYIDYSDPYFIETQTVLVRYPDPTAKHWRIYLDPFQWDVWTCVVLSVPTAGIILWMFQRLSPCYSAGEKRAGLGKIGESLWYSFGSFFTQGSDYLPDAQSGRFVVGFWLMYCLVVIASYSGNLVAFFTVSNPTVPFNSLQDMINSTFLYGLMDGTHGYAHVMGSTRGTFKKIGDAIRRFEAGGHEVVSFNHAELLEKVQEGNFAYITERSSALIETSKTCNVDIIKEEFIPEKYAIALRNNSAYSDIFNLGLEQLSENGLAKRWKQDWWPHRSYCDRGLQTSSRPISVSDMQGAFFLMALVLSVAMITLFIELSIWGKKKSRAVTHNPGIVEQQTPQMGDVRFDHYKVDYGR